MELSDFFVFLFVLITIGLAIFVYNWSEEVASLFVSLRTHIEGFFYSVCFQFTYGELLCKSCYLALMSQDSDYRTAVGETYYLKLIKSEIENIPVPHQGMAGSFIFLRIPTF